MRLQHLPLVETITDKKLENEVNNHAGPPIQRAWRIWLAGQYNMRTRPNTVRTYQRATTLAAQRWPETAPTAGQIEAWCNELLAAGMAATTVNLYLKSISAVALVAARVESTQQAHALADAFALARRLPMPRRRPRALPEGEIDAILAACDNPAEVAFIRLQAICGLRIGEVLALTSADIETENRRLYVKATRDRNSGTCSNRRKNLDDHIVDLDDETLAAVEWAIAHHGEICPRGPAARKADNYIFPWAATMVLKLQRKYIRASHAFASWHQLRHTGATAVYDITGSVGKVQEYLGDKSASAAMCYAAPLRGQTACDAQAIANHLVRKKCKRVTLESRSNNAEITPSATYPVGVLPVSANQRKVAK
jgi:integrase